MTSAVTRRTPPQRFADAMNPVVRAVLRSPLHLAVDRSLLMLHVSGRRTGRRYDIRRIGRTITARRTPTLAELDEAVREYDLATITLTPS